MVDINSSWEELTSGQHAVEQSGWYQSMVTGKLGRMMEQTAKSTDKLNKRILWLNWIMAVAAIIQAVAAGLTIYAWKR